MATVGVIKCSSICTGYGNHVALWKLKCVTVSCVDTGKDIGSKQCRKSLEGLDDWLTVHRSITLVNFQLDAQNSYLFIYNTFIKILYTFRALPCSSSGGLRRNCLYAASGIVTLCRWLSCAPVNPLNAELNPICYLLALLAHHFLHVSRIRVKSLTLGLLMSYIHGAPILDVSRSHTTTQHSR